MQKSKNKKLYDDDGRWVEERNRIKGAIRRVFRLSPQMKEVLQAARVELPPITKKDGNPGKKNQVRYRCAHCGELFSQKHVQVDHNQTVVPLWKSESDMTYDEIARGIFCEKENLQVLCSTPMRLNGGKHSCHKKKTDFENWIRRSLFEKFESSKELREECFFNTAWGLNYQKYLKEREEKKNNGRKRKNTKRERNPQSDQGN